MSAPTHIERHLTHSKALDLTGLDFDDAEGMAIVRKIDEKIAALPGLEGWRGYETCIGRSKARFGRSLGVIGEGQVVAPRLA